MKINDKGSKIKIVKNIRNAEHKRCFDRKIGINQNLNFLSVKLQNMFF